MAVTPGVLADALQAVADPNTGKPLAAGKSLQNIRIDGNDPSTVEDAVRRARERAAGGGGPTLIEAMTERLVGH